MRVAKRTRLCVTLMLAVGAATLILGCEGAGKQASSVAEAAPDGATQQGTLKAPPIPEAGPLARPKALRQVGVPDGATRAAIPPDNPPTPEKIALGQRLFFDGRLSADGTVACSTCHDPARAFTDGRPAHGVPNEAAGLFMSPHHPCPSVGCARVRCVGARKEA